MRHQLRLILVNEQPMTKINTLVLQRRKMVLKKKISFIGILMAASWLLLCLFVSRWTTSQYKEQKAQLRQEVNMTLQQIKERINDSMANRVVQGILEKDKTPTRTKGNIQLSSVSNITINRPAPSAFPPLFPGVSNSRVAMDSISPIRDSFNLARIVDSQAIHLILRNVLIKLMSDTGARAKMTITGNGTETLYRRSIEAALKKKHLVLQDSSEILNHSDSDFVFRLAGLDMVFPVGGTRVYILKKLVPQITFSVTLLLLVGLAFLLAYWNLKKQMRFNEQKDAFIANMSHELKTPVATAKVAIEALQQHQAIHHPERAERYLGVAGWELDRLQTMMEKILNSLPENEKDIILQKTKTNIKPILLRLAEIIQSTQKEATITFVWTLPEQPVYVDADELHFTNVIYNLFDNAVKYGGREIHITVDESPEQVTIRIADDGPGIAAAYRNKVFDRFFRIPSGNRHNVKGYGLGLSYVRQMVEAHKGSIHLAAGPETCFIIQWPKFKT